MDALEVGGGLTGDVGTRHKEQTSIASSVILVAIGTFAIGLCAVPFVKVCHFSPCELGRCVALQSLCPINLGRHFGRLMPYVCVLFLTGRAGPTKQNPTKTDHGKEK